MANMIIHRGAGLAPKRTLTGAPSELCQSSFCKGVRPWLRIIQDPISRLNPDLPAATGAAQAGMLYRQIQYLVEEGDWAQQGEEVSVEGQLS